MSLPPNRLRICRRRRRKYRAAASLIVWAATAALAQSPQELSSTELDPAALLSQVQSSTTGVPEDTPRSAWVFPGETNTPPSAEKPAAAKAVDSHQTQFEVARHNRLAGLFTQATAGYVALLQGDAPEELKRAALMELAQVACEQNQPARAQQIYAQYLSRWPKDAGVPEVLLRQALLLRQMGLPGQAIAKLYAVMTSALSLKPDRIDYYQKLVLRAQNEIAETHYELGNWAEAADSFSRLLKLEPPPSNGSWLQFRLIQCLVALGRRGEAVAQASNFLDHYAEAPERPEVQFLCATCLKQLRRDAEARSQVLALLAEQHSGSARSHQTLAYWQRRAGNEIANQFYQQGEVLMALDIYLALAGLDASPEWQMPVCYQIGLVCERLHQPAKAAEYFGRVAAEGKRLDTNAPPSLLALTEMAKWRQEELGWQVKTEAANRGFRASLSGPADTNAPPLEARRSQLGS